MSGKTCSPPSTPELSRAADAVVGLEIVLPVDGGELHPVVVAQRVSGCAAESGHRERVEGLRKKWPRISIKTSSASSNGSPKLLAL